MLVELACFSVTLFIVLGYLYKNLGLRDEVKNHEAMAIQAIDSSKAEFQNEEEIGETYSIKKFKGILNVGANFKATFNNIRDSSFVLNQFVLKSKRKKVDAILSKDDRKLLAEKLRDHHSRVTSWLIPLPWLENHAYPSEDYFVEPNIIERSRDGKRDKHDRQLTEIFAAPERSQLPPKRILLRGEAGYGKTTICIHLAQTWATKTQDFLSRFKYLLLFCLRDLNQANDVEKALLIEISKFIPSRIEDSALIDLTRNISKSLLLILDGYDECKFEQMISVNDILTTSTSNNVFRDATIMLTSRYPPSTAMFKYFSKHLLIIGLNESRRDLFLQKFFNNLSLNSSIFKETFSFLYETKDLSPLMLYLLCFVLEDNSNSKRYFKFTTTSSLLEEVVRLLGLRYCDKHSVKINYTEMNRQFNLIGTLFHRALRNGDNFVTESDISSLQGLMKDFALKCGILVKRNKAYGQVYEPLHKCFMEYLCIHYYQFQVDISKDEIQLKDFLTSLQLPVWNELSVDLDSNDIFISFEIYPGIYCRWRIGRKSFLEDVRENITLRSCEFMDAEKYFSLLKNKDLKVMYNLDVGIVSNFGNDMCSILKPVKCDDEVTFLIEFAELLQNLTQFLTNSKTASETMNLTYSNLNSTLYEMNRLQGMDKVTMFTEIKFALNDETWHIFNHKLTYIFVELFECKSVMPEVLEDLTFMEYVYRVMSTLTSNRFVLDVFFEIQAPEIQFRYFCKYEASKSKFSYLLERKLGRRSEGIVSVDNFLEHHLDKLSDIYFNDAIPQNFYKKRPHFLRFDNPGNLGNFKLHLKLFDTWDFDPVIFKLREDLGITDVFSPHPIIEKFSDTYIEHGKRYLCVFVNCN